MSRNRVAALDKGAAVACALRLVAKYSVGVEDVIIMLQEYQFSAVDDGFCHATVL